MLLSLLFALTWLGSAQIWGKRNVSLATPFLLQSPSNGTDIIRNPIPLIKCANQTMCIQPHLQLQRTYKVYYCKHVGHGVRFYFLVKEGLLLHPNLHLVDNGDKADVVVYLPVSADWDKTECNNPRWRNKTLVLDEGDWPTLFEAPGKTDWLLYFKRSYVSRGNGVFKKYMDYIHKPTILPMTYPIAEAYVRNKFTLMKDRDVEITTTLRGSKSDPCRQRVRQWVEEYCRARGVKKFVAGEVNHASRTVVSTGYLGQMYRSRIVVTSNPSGWEGDFRLMEAIATGALIFVDQMYVPRPFPLTPDQHVVVYDNNNKTDFFEKMDFYRKNTERSRRVAVGGYLHSMKFHRAPCLLDYIFRTIHVKQVLESQGPDAARSLQYTSTGFHMRQRALENSKRIKPIPL
jgi:hypothetical protein